MKEMLRRNGLSIAMIGMFFLFQCGLSFVGWQHYNQEQADHNEPAITYSEYLVSPDFWVVTMENWESEFLQMFAFVVMTVFLFQHGSPESKKLDTPEAVDRDPRRSKNKKNAPWPVRSGGLILKIYEYSLSLALLFLFIISFVFHAAAGTQAYNEEQIEHGQQTITLLQYLGSSQFWFESLQNWQSEFFSIGVLVLLTIVLRQRGSPESKPVDSPHSMTGHE